MNRVLAVIGGVVLAAVLVAGGFLAGVNLGKAQAQEEQAAFFRSRGVDPGAVAPGAGGFGGRGGLGGGQGQRAGAAGAGAAGTIDKIEGNTLTVTTNQGDTITVQIADDTPVVKEVAESKSDLGVGMRVLVVGERSGTNVAARGSQSTDGAGGLGGLVGGPRVTPTPGK
jgi:hypothetical protein